MRDRNDIDNIFDEDIKSVSVSNLTPEEIEELGEDRINSLKRREEIEKNHPRNTKEDLQDMLKELSFEHKVFRENWTNEEREKQREKFDKWFEEVKEKAGKRIAPIIESLNSWVMDVDVSIVWDSEKNKYRAECGKVGLVMESESYDELIEKIRISIPEKLESEKIQTYMDLRIITEERKITIPITNVKRIQKKCPRCGLDKEKIEFWNCDAITYIKCPECGYTLREGVETPPGIEKLFDAWNSSDGKERVDVYTGF